MTTDQLPPSVDPSKLDRLAETAVRVGLGLEPGQPLVITAPVEALPLVRRIAHHAYAAGASLVTPVLSDPAVTLARFEAGRDASFDAAPAWLYDGMAKAFDGKGNYTLGLKEQIIFPEINYDRIDVIKGLNITLVTTALNDEEGRALLTHLGMPFRAT